MSENDFEYIECPPGMEQGPAIENTAPYCVPADEANLGEPIIVLPGFPDNNDNGIDDRLEFEVPVEVTPVPVAPYTPRELAATGSDAGVVVGLLLIVGLLLAAGFTLWKLRK